MEPLPPPPSSPKSASSSPTPRLAYTSFPNSSGSSTSLLPLPPTNTLAFINEDEQVSEGRRGNGGGRGTSDFELRGVVSKYDDEEDLPPYISESQAQDHEHRGGGEDDEDDEQEEDSSRPLHSRLFHLLGQWWSLFWDWLKSSPLNWFIAFCGFIVVGVGAMVFFLMIGVDVPKGHDKALWLEVGFQILNSIFTLSAVCTHPIRTLDLYRALTLRPKLDHVEEKSLRDQMEYGSQFHSHRHIPEQDALASCGRYSWFTSSSSSKDLMCLIYILLFFHASCFSQYGVASAMWLWNSTDRPPLIIAICLPISFLTNAIGGITNAVKSHRHEKAQKERNNQERRKQKNQGEWGALNGDI